MADFGGRYRLVRRLGAGGMGEVWLAHDQELYGRPVAIKTMHPHMLAHADGVARFQREMRLACRMQHPNIMTVFTSGSDNGVPFMVMEYLQGKDLAKAPPGHSADEVARIGRDTCTALAYAHGLEVVHRDIKPANLFVCDTGMVKVTDFGIAKAVGGTRLSATGILIGTSPYIAPEQWLGEPAGFSNDIWAVGCVLYELLAGRLPRSYETDVEYAAAAARQEPVPPLQVPGVPGWLSDAVMAMLQFDPGRRPTAAQCVELLAGPREPAAPGTAPAKLSAQAGAGYSATDGNAAVALADRKARLLADAERIARSITDERRQAEALTGIGSQVATSDPSGAVRLLADAERIARSITEQGQVAPSPSRPSATEVLVEVASGMAAVDPDRAERIALSIEGSVSVFTPKWQQARALVGVADRLAAGDPERAERIARSITQEYYEAEALIGITKTVAAEDPGHATRLFADAERIAQSIANSPAEAKVMELLGEIAAGVAAADPDRAERIARSITEEFYEAEALIGIANRVAAEDPGRAARLFADAERIAQSIADYADEYGAHALGEIAVGVAALDPSRAERIARSITEESYEAEALIGIANRVAVEDPGRAARLFADAERIAQSMEYYGAEALIGVAAGVTALDPSRAERIARSITDEMGQAMALTRVAMKIV